MIPLRRPWDGAPTPPAFAGKSGEPPAFAGQHGSRSLDNHGNKRPAQNEEHRGEESHRLLWDILRSCDSYHSTAPSRCIGCKLGDQHAGRAVSKQVKQVVLPRRRGTPDLT